MARHFERVFLPRHSRLFHGSLEPFETVLSPGGDGLVWFSDMASIAQLYIPKSGLRAYVATDELMRPHRDKLIQSVQQRVGLYFDYASVKWDATGMARSWRDPPPPFDGLDFTARRKLIDERLTEFGYVGEGWHKIWKFRFHNGRLLDPDEAVVGRLFVAVTLRDMILWKKSIGEGNLLEPQHNDLRGFAAAERAGLDGVLIDDFAQSEEWGNFGHLSVGLFEASLGELDVEVYPASYEEFEYNHADATRAFPWSHQPYFSQL